MKTLFALGGIGLVGFILLVASAVLEAPEFAGWVLFIGALGTAIGFRIYESIYLPWEANAEARSRARYETRINSLRKWR